MNTMTLLGIDIGKHSFHLHGQDAKGHQVLRKKNQPRPIAQHIGPTAGLHGSDGVSTDRCVGP